MPNLGYGLPGEIADESGVSAHRLSGLSTSPGLPGRIGSDKGFSWLGCLGSWFVRDIGDVSLTDELKTGFEKPLGGVVLSIPLLASNFCSWDLSNAWALLWYFS